MNHHLSAYSVILCFDLNIVIIQFEKSKFFKINMFINPIVSVMNSLLLSFNKK